MREVIVFKSEMQETDGGRLKFVKVFETTAHFHQWAQDSNGQGEQVPVAIVELSDGSIRSVYCEMVVFAQATGATDAAQVVSL